MTLAELNALSPSEAARAFLQCCGSTLWAKLMMERLPFEDMDALLAAADEADAALDEPDWLEAFAAHPRIGEHSASAWSQAEQAAALTADQQVRQELARLNAAYEEKFGFIFIVFAAGKSPQQILRFLEARLQSDRTTEIGYAAAEQRQITRARLHKLLES